MKRIDLVKTGESFVLCLKLDSAEAGEVVFRSVSPVMNRAEAEYRLFRLSSIYGFDKSDFPVSKEE